ncbi:MAG: hypothetical protein KGD63_02845 [Candidatus Lokiarchaeota archaeon]|nr:hypothetical protein [Candidatus Lokiarchaeota archaeon]
MNKVKIFIITNNSRFFYNVNSKLKELKIDFKIIEFKDKFPRIPSIILSTFEESKLLKTIDRTKSIILPYKKQDDFKKYIFNLTKIYYCGKESYSNLLFSIDPGQVIGLAIFLDGHYFYSKSYYDENILFLDINECIENLFENNKDPLDIIFKFGTGVFNLTKKLISKIYKIYNQSDMVKIHLVNESKSSKIKFHKLSEKIFKHEASAIILALRKGIEVDRGNYFKFFDLMKANKDMRKQLEEELDNVSFLCQNIELLKILFLDIINYKISINKVIDIIKEKELLSVISE